MQQVMAKRALFALVCGVLGSCATPKSASVADSRTAPEAAPVIDSVTFHKETRRYETVYPEFHFHDPSGRCGSSAGRSLRPTRRSR